MLMKLKDLNGLCSSSDCIYRPQINDIVVKLHSLCKELSMCGIERNSVSLYLITIQIR